MENPELPEPYSMIEHELGNILSKARVAKLENELEQWEEFEEFLEQTEKYTEMFRKGDSEGMETVRKEIDETVDSNSIPERSLGFVGMALDSFDAAEAYDEALNEGPAEGVSVDEIVSGVENESKLRIDQLQVDYEDESLKDEVVYGNKSLWLIPHTAAINSYQHSEADSIEIFVSESDDEVLMSVYDNGKGIGKNETEFIEQGNQGAKAIDFLSRRYGVGWTIETEEEEYTLFNFRFQKL